MFVSSLIRRLVSASASSRFRPPPARATLFPNMPTSIVNTVARRFLTGKKRNSFLSFIALVSLFGVCLGVAALTVVMGVMEGFESQLRSIITGTHSHIVLYSTRQMIPNQLEMEERVRQALKILGKR